MRLGRAYELVLAGAIALAGTGYVLIPPGEASSAPGTSEWASSSRMIQDQFQAEGRVRPLSPDAARVAMTALSMTSGGVGSDPFAALTMSPTTEIDLGQAGRLQVSILDDDTRDAAYNVFAITTDEHSPLVLARDERDATVAVNYERRFEAEGQGEQLDVSVTPRAAVSLGPDGSAAGAGAEVRVGRHLQANPQLAPTWYVFAGADRRALLYDPAQGMDFRDGVYLTRREVIGDMQAGVAMRVGDADVSVAYVRREYKHVAGVTSFDESEQFGAVTLNLRW
jgi:hypothetical protein